MEIYLCRGYAFNSSADFETIRELKEKFCFVSCDIKGDRKLDGETTYYNSYYKLPDGRQVKISNEKFEAPEILFSPYLVNSESDGIHELVFNCINVKINIIILKINRTVLLIQEKNYTVRLSFLEQIPCSLDFHRDWNLKLKIFIKKEF